MKNQKFRPRLSHNAPHHGRRAQKNGDSRPLFFGSPVKPSPFKPKGKVASDATKLEDTADGEAEQGAAQE